MQGFDPVIVGSSTANKTDNIGIVTTQDGPSLEQGEIIAPPVGMDPNGEHYHNNYQDIEAFLAAGGRRGKQYAPLLDGTYFINHWFATIELIPKEVVSIGEVGVVVSYYGKQGSDTSGVKFRHGERVHRGERGVWETTLGPGKYPFNTYAGQIIRVPTTNFVLHWITGKSEGHRYDESLKSVDLITKDAYEPILPLSVVVHIDYEKAPNVIQRFGDVKKLITQTIDPMLSAYFRDVAHKKTMLELVHSRDEIQSQARTELRARFEQFDIECVDVLIGRPEARGDDNKIENLLEQLRLRQLSLEQIETYSKQEQAAGKLKDLNNATATATMQEQLTQSEDPDRDHLEPGRGRAGQSPQGRRAAGGDRQGRQRERGPGGTRQVGKRQPDRRAPRPASCRKRCNPSATAGCTRCRWSPNRWPTASSRWSPATALGGDGSQGGMLGTLMSLLVADKLGVPVPTRHASLPAVEQPKA